MHESDKNPVENELKRLNETLDRIAETQMMLFIQMSRLYDLFAVSALNLPQDEVEKLMDMHEQGILFTQAPVLRQNAFGHGYEEPVQHEKSENSE